MPRFFTSDISDNTAVISGGDAVHIGRSLRMRLGDEIIVCRGGIEYVCTIRSISDERVICDILTSRKTLAEPSVKLTLFQAVPKLDKLELIVQKATELGACGIVPVLTERCVSRPDAKSFAKKRERLQKIAEEAAKQSGRGIIPNVGDIISLDNAISEMAKCDIALMFYEKGGRALSDLPLSDAGSIGILIGSEGGFDEKEAERCAERGIIPVGLGARILRCETAPIAAISIIMHITGNMDQI